MKENIHSWLTDKMKTTGILACGLRAPDRKTFTRSQSSQFTPVALDHACRCIADAFQVLNSNRFPSEVVRWVYEQHCFYGSMRPDGICLAILTRREPPNLQPADLDQIIAEFQHLET